ncbi:MAG: 4'-phosphopantetheinyl transferase superfamily protein [Chromatiaceae bacterium]|nr:4'-phosphopantetheinyl transferase superfamily protein [Chromatiaceae bacterium]MCP5408817.1 4'-phosphopantetheinyl transferase superfamily protein [Chromatiaceae bacterium]MCP5445076.1 4'-phosphopantetheinyl transferase superfamily protein [Chromatiaceae bacterium]
MKTIQSWSPPPEKPVLPRSGELHLWLIDLDIQTVNLERYLSPDEHDRAQRMLRAEGSRRFVAARACMRKILADYLATDAGLINFRYGSAGKPEIVHPGSDLRFNLSHSGHLALLALTHQSEIGVDMEPLKQQPNLLAISRKIFGAEVQKTLAAMDEPRQKVRFFQLWTELEARAKCKGSGVFSQTDDTIPAVNFAPETGWIAAVASSRGIPQILEWLTYRLIPSD